MRKKGGGFYDNPNSRIPDWVGMVFAIAIVISIIARLISWLIQNYGLG